MEKLHVPKRAHIAFGAPLRYPLAAPAMIRQALTSPPSADPVQYIGENGLTFAGGSNDNPQSPLRDDFFMEGAAECGMASP